jgi:twinkle protein
MKNQIRADEKFVRHAPCNNCNSQNNLAIYEFHSYCFGCLQWTSLAGFKSVVPANGEPIQKIQRKEMLDLIEGSVNALPKRQINSETCKKFNYETGIYNGRDCHISNYYDKQYSLVAQHIRFADKSFKWLGDTDKISLFGQNLWRDGGKSVIITEGEIDCMSVSQVQGNKYPVVSVPSGASSAKKYIKRELEWLSKFEKIILMFDNDEAGTKASVECANILPVKKAYIAKLPMKDANELLVSNLGSKIVDSMWEAKAFSPAGIIEGIDTKELLLKDEVIESYPYCWNGLNEKLNGIRLGELNLICGGTGTGKSQVCREIGYNLIKQKVKIGYIALEESVKRSVQGFVSIGLNKQIHIPEVKKEIPKEELIKEWEGLKDYVAYYDHFGSHTTEDLINKIRYMVTALDCKIIFLDHISIVISGLENNDERRLIDNTMTSLRQLVEELKCGMFVVSHLKRPDNKTSHEEGLQVSLSHLRGSHSLATLSNQVISFERNQQSELESNILTCRVLKNRFSGDCGIASTLIYNKENGRLSEGDFDE